jgi:succinate-acetate transporter protein
MEPRIESLTRITLRPFGTPLPLGFLAFGTGVMLLTAFDAHWIPYSEQKLVGALALGFVVPLEIMASVFAFLARDTAGGTAMGLFGATWTATCELGTFSHLSPVTLDRFRELEWGRFPIFPLNATARRCSR